MNEHKYIITLIGFIILAGLRAVLTFVNFQGLMNGK